MKRPGFYERLMPLLLFLALLYPVHSTAEDLKTYDGGGVLVRYDRRLEKAALSLAAEYTGVRSETEKMFGWKIDFVPTIVLVRDHRQFLKSARSDLVTAFAVPGEDLIVIDYSKMERTPFDLSDTVKHELSHLILHRSVQDHDLPKWLDEGLAQWASGGMADIVYPERDTLKQAVVSGNLLPLKLISRTFPAEQGGLVLAYEESKSFVEFIVAKYGRGSVLSVVEALGKGVPLDRSVSENLGEGMDVLEKKWRATLTRRYSWPLFIVDHLYWVLFFGAAVASVAGYLRLRRRMKTYRDEEDEDSAGDGNSSDVR